MTRDPTTTRPRRPHRVFAGVSNRDEQEARGRSKKRRGATKIGPAEIRPGRFVEGC
jgi:hypothetical protein